MLVADVAEVERVERLRKVRHLVDPDPVIGQIGLDPLDESVRVVHVIEAGDARDDLRLWLDSNLLAVYDVREIATCNHDFPGAHDVPELRRRLVSNLSQRWPGRPVAALASWLAAFWPLEFRILRQ